MITMIGGVLDSMQEIDDGIEMKGNALFTIIANEISEKIETAIADVIKFDI